MINDKSSATHESWNEIFNNSFFYKSTAWSAGEKIKSVNAGKIVGKKVDGLGFCATRRSTLSSWKMKNSSEYDYGEQFLLSTVVTLILTYPDNYQTGVDVHWLLSCLILKIS